MREHPWRIAFWGVRGSLPVARAEFLEYGGNTSCVSADCGETLVVFDAGSGLPELGRRLAGGPGRRLDLLIGHVHLDHILGLPCFQPLHDPAMEVHLYGEARDGLRFRERLEAVLGPPYWPLGLDDFRAKITVHELTPGQTFELPGGITVRTLRANHPNGCLLYRLDGGGKSLVYALDCETEPETFRELAEFARGAGLLVWDAAFTPEDLPARRGWGHSSWKDGAALREAAGIGAAYMAHYAPEYTDAFLRELEEKAGPAVRFAREGMEVLL